MPVVRQRDRAAILNALRSGVVPGRGLQHLHVGRLSEVTALADDIKTIKDGGSTVRVVVGPFGAGKSFFLQIVQDAARSAGCVTMRADITQDARLYGTGGRVTALYSALVSTAATKTQPDGGAIAEVLERFVGRATEIARREGRDADDVVEERLGHLRAYPGGYQFADVVKAYWAAASNGDEPRRQAVLRWMRGEYRTKTEAEAALGVKGIVGDGDLYPTLALLARLVVAAGYAGLVVCLDELAVLTRLNRPTRDSNYEQILTMINRLHRGEAPHLGVLLAGTPQMLRDPERGLFSYAALAQRLGVGEWARPGMLDVAGPVLTLQRLEPEHLFTLLEQIHTVYCSNGNRDPLPETAGVIAAFLDRVGRQAGGLTNILPREIARGWVRFLDVLSQNPQLDWSELLGVSEVGPGAGPDTDGSDTDTNETESDEDGERASSGASAPSDDGAAQFRITFGSLSDLPVPADEDDPAAFVL